MVRNYDELRKKILGKYGSLAPFAKDLGITPSTLSTKLKGKTDWSRAEIARTKELLGLTLEEVFEYFFN